MDTNTFNVGDGEPSKKKAKAKIIWDNNTFMVFIEECITKQNNGNRPTTHFNKIGWANIEKKVKERTGRKLGQKTT